MKIVLRAIQMGMCVPKVHYITQMQRKLWKIITYRTPTWNDTAIVCGIMVPEEKSGNKV